VGWSVDVHESWEGAPLLEVSDIVNASTQETTLAGTGMGKHIIQLRDTGLFSKKPTDAERAYVRDLFAHWSRKIVVRCDDETVYDGWIGRRKFIDATGELQLTTFEMRTAQLGARLTYGVNGYLSGSLSVAGRSHAGAVRAIVNRAVEWGPGFHIPLDPPPDGAGDFTADWPWWQHNRIEDLLQQVEKAGSEVFFRPYKRESDGAARYETQVGAPVISSTFPLSFSAANSPVTGLEDDEDGTQMLTGVQYQGNGSDQDAILAGAVWSQIYPGAEPTFPIRDVLRTAKKILDPGNLSDIALADLQRDHKPISTQPFDLQMGAGGSALPDLPVTAAWGRVGVLLESKQRANEWVGEGTRTHRVTSCKTDLSDTLNLKVERVD
jgi:hypothetical protein